MTRPRAGGAGRAHRGCRAVGRGWREGASARLPVAPEEEANFQTTQRPVSAWPGPWSHGWLRAPRLPGRAHRPRRGGVWPAEGAGQGRRGGHWAGGDQHTRQPPTRRGRPGRDAQAGQGRLSTKAGRRIKSIINILPGKNTKSVFFSEKLITWKGAGRPRGLARAGGWLPSPALGPAPSVPPAALLRQGSSCPARRPRPAACPAQLPASPQMSR